MFAFISITYNHEEYILEHLESIKYQIENYGNGQAFELVICDDCSKDKTTEFAINWIDNNDKLFNRTRILVNDENQGTVKNYLKAVQLIEAERYKILAGDDLYYKNNIFEIETDYDIVLTPVIELGPEGISSRISDTYPLLIKTKSIEEVRNLLSYGLIFRAAGTFIKAEIIKDVQLQSFIGEYKWIEDFPTWFYLFNVKKSLRYSIKTKPYIIYRLSSGITNKKHSFSNSFLAEEEKMRTRFGLKTQRYPKYINPYKYYFKLRKLKAKHIESRFDEELIAFTKLMNNQVNEAIVYLKLLKNRTRVY